MSNQDNFHEFWGLAEFLSFNIFADSQCKQSYGGGFIILHTSQWIASIK